MENELTGDKLIIDKLEFYYYSAAYRFKQLKKENANLKRKLTKLKKASEGNQANSENANCAIFDDSKRYRFTMKDVDTNEIIIIDEDTERKAFRKAFRFLGEKKVKDRELNIVSKVDNVC